MKSFYFREILLASNKEKKAKRVAFDPAVTVIKGGNETGKSSLLKSIFRTFGAEPSKVHPRWLNADVRSVVKFDVNDIPYALLRHGDHFALFDGAGRLMHRYQRVTSELAPAISNIVGFGLRLLNRDGKFVVLPPAYYFLPSYMDQDGSWGDQWTGFAKLGQFSNWKKGVIEYHAGIRGNEYYEAQAVKLDAESAAERLARKREGLQETYNNLRERFDMAQFDVDFSAFRTEVDELLTQCEVLRRREEKYKQRVTELRNERQSLRTQLDITTHAREEASRDYTFAASQDDAVDCPTCGASYDNSFVERFAIAMDEDNCSSLIIKLTEELSEIDVKIERELEDAKKLSDEVHSIERLLARREGEIALSDLVRQAGRRELRDVMQRDLAHLEAGEGELRVSAKAAEKRMRQLDGKERRQAVNAFFYTQMQAFLGALDVNGVSEDRIKQVDATLTDTGSELPRALLAYKIAFLHTATEFGTAVPAPLVIDSPNQQDQDEGHLHRILSFIRDRRPPNRQLILGLVDTAGVEFGGKEIELHQKHSLLQEADSDAVRQEVQYYVDLAVAQ
ncbi:MAG TPA: hypothetical protein VFN67_10305 [Polyangiales bacterium]|nr:hypothetical protein [Polyangiales bacterium]